MKIDVGSQKPPIVIPVILVPVEIQVALAIPRPVEVRHIAVAVRVHPDRNVQGIIRATAP